MKDIKLFLTENLDSQLICESKFRLDEFFNNDRFEIHGDISLLKDCIMTYYGYYPFFIYLKDRNVKSNVFISSENNKTIITIDNVSEIGVHEDIQESAFRNCKFNISPGYKFSVYGHAQGRGSKPMYSLSYFVRKIELFKNICTEESKPSMIQIERAECWDIKDFNELYDTIYNWCDNVYFYSCKNFGDVLKEWNYYKGGSKIKFSSDQKRVNSHFAKLSILSNMDFDHPEKYMSKKDLIKYKELEEIKQAENKKQEKINYTKENPIVLDVTGYEDGDNIDTKRIFFTKPIKSKLYYLNLYLYGREGYTSNDQKEFVRELNQYPVGSYVKVISDKHGILKLKLIKAETCGCSYSHTWETTYCFEEV